VNIAGRKIMCMNVDYNGKKKIQTEISAEMEKKKSYRAFAWSFVIYVYELVGWVVFVLRERNSEYLLDFYVAFHAMAIPMRVNGFQMSWTMTIFAAKVNQSTLV
jgi:hypothetical protein